VNLYSHSRISSFEDCPRKYAFRYIEKVPSDWEGIEAFVGKRVHEILERLYHHLRVHGRPPSLAQMLTRFRLDWHAQWHPQVRIVRAENDMDHYVRHGEQCIGAYYRSQYPFDDGETVAIEENIQVSLDPAGVYRMRGIIDRVVRTRTGSYEVHDYKTGGYLPPLKRLATDRQLAIYQIGLQQTHPDAQEVELVWHYLAFNKTLRVRRTEDDLALLRQATMARIDEIEAASEFPPRPGPLCRWCEYAEVCPASGRAVSEALSVVPQQPVPPARKGQLPLF
jgi:putative RecB family exonuclease